jgi:hypothetical protein
MMKSLLLGIIAILLTISLYAPESLRRRLRRIWRRR